MTEEEYYPEQEKFFTGACCELPYYKKDQTNTHYEKCYCIKCGSTIWFMQKRNWYFQVYHPIKKLVEWRHILEEDDKEEQKKKVIKTIRRIDYTETGNIIKKVNPLEYHGP